MKWLGLLFLLCGTLQATVLKPSSAVWGLESMGWGARSAGMADTLAVMEEEISAWHINPASLGTLDLPQFVTNRHDQPIDIQSENYVLAAPYKNYGTFLFAGSIRHFGGFEGRDDAGNFTHEFQVKRLGLHLGWARGFYNRIFLGLGINSWEQTQDTKNFQATAADIGIMIRLNPWLNSGVSYQNIGGQLGDVRMPTPVNISLLYHSTLNPFFQIQLGINARLDSNHQNYINTGLELGIKRKIYLRMGYQADLVNQHLDGQTSLRLGLGVVLQHLRLDYALVPLGDAGTTNKISLTYLYGRPTPLITLPVSVEDHFNQPPAPPAIRVENTVDNPPPVSDDRVNQPADKPGIKNSGQVTPAALSSEAAGKLKLNFYLAEEENMPFERPLDTEMAKLYDHIQLNPADNRAWRDLGNMYFKNKLHEQALRCYEKVLKMNPDDEALKQWLDGYRKKYAR